MADLNALAERVEKAGGGSRELDEAVSRAVYAFCEWRPCYGPKPPWTGPASRYSTSLDAAMTLVPEGWEIEKIGQTYGGVNRGKWECGLYSRNPGLGPQSSTNDPFVFVGNAKTPALALCAAALRAHAKGPAL